ncbi:CrcB family protein [Cryobacterium luteum]|uniref:CrcB family protein n=1 Tax=Cryobacterium luteum TaxID=1424661 RepID=UPI001582D53A
MDTITPRPAHFTWRYLGLVFVGGTAGTALREGLGLLLPAGTGLPLITLGINLVGALLLGLLLEALVRRGADAAGRRRLRLLLGTGLLGGFTTYSALASDSALLLQGGEIQRAVAYALGTVLLGGLATWLGVVLAAALHRESARGQNR